jgi:hypothetical protein
MDSENEETVMENTRNASVADSVSCALWIVMRCVGLALLCLAIVEMPKAILGTMTHGSQVDIVAEAQEQPDADSSKLILLLNDSQQQKLLVSWASLLTYLCVGLYLTRRGQALHNFVRVIPSRERKGRDDT